MGWLTGSSLGAGPTQTQEKWAAEIGVTSEGQPDFVKLVKIVNGSRIPDDAVQKAGQLGRGTFGAVFRGTYNGKPIAVKSIGLTGTVYDSGNHSVDDFFRQIKLEIEAMSAVGTHGNCVGFFGHTAHFPGSGEGKPAFRMELLLELMPNGELFTHLHEKKMFQTWPEKIRILRGIATGVQYLHSKDIVHRDLSSVNILFCENWTPKIGDFGCARVIKGGTYDPKKVLGSPAYMSPEQLVGSPLRTNSDVWALGVLIWEVISERGPWNDRNSNDRAILKQHIVDNSGKLPQIPSTRFEVMYAKHYESQVADLLAGCFRVTPTKRISAADVLSALSAMDGPLQKTVYKNGVATLVPMTTTNTTTSNAPPNVPPVIPIAPEQPKKTPNSNLASGPAVGSAEYKELLEKKIRAFYIVHNPTKLEDVHLVAKYHVGQEDLLNKKFRDQYKTDLIQFCTENPNWERWPCNSISTAIPGELPSAGSQAQSGTSLGAQPDAPAVAPPAALAPAAAPAAPPAAAAATSAAEAAAVGQAAAAAQAATAAAGTKHKAPIEGGGRDGGGTCSVYTPRQKEDAPSQPAVPHSKPCCAPLCLVM